MRLWPLRLVLGVLILGVFGLGELNAQTTTSGALAGVITDQSNAVIADADIEIRDIGKDTRQSTKTDRQGVYRFSFLLPGTYTLSVRHVGFRGAQRVVDVLLGPPVFGRFFPQLLLGFCFRSYSNRQGCPSSMAHVTRRTRKPRWREKTRTMPKLSPTPRLGLRTGMKHAPTPLVPPFIGHYLGCAIAQLEKRLCGAHASAEIDNSPTMIWPPGVRRSKSSSCSICRSSTSLIRL
jgi:Carboxypeptidase regulatory-like domain